METQRTEIGRKREQHRKNIARGIPKEEHRRRPGRTSDFMAKKQRKPRKQRGTVPEGYQGVYRIPCQYTLFHGDHVKKAETQGYRQ